MKMYSFKNIFVKYIVKNMFEKKSRLFLFVLSIAVSTMLFVSSLGLVDVINDSFSKSFKSVSEGMNVVITSEEKDPFFKEKDLKLGNLQVEIREVSLSGIFDSEDEVRVTSIKARKVEDIDKSIIVDGSIDSFKDNECIISKRISEKLNKRENDKINIAINGESIEFVICAISANESLFYADTETNFTVVIPYEFVNKKYELNDKFNVLYSTSDNIDSEIEDFNKLNSGLKAKKMLNDTLSSQYNAFFSAVYAMFVIVVLICFMIIYGAFNLIISERLSTIGTFFSQGATRRDVKKVIYLESIGYGVIGGIIGISLGTLLLYLVHINISPLAEYGIREQFTINSLYLILGFIFATLLSFISILIPVKKVDKMNVKEIILNNIHVSVKVPWYPFIIGCLMIAVSIIYLFIDTKEYNYISPVALIFSIVGIVLVTRKIVCLFTGLIVKLLRGRFNTAFLSMNNLTTSKVLLNNVSLIGIAVLVGLLVNTTSISLINMTTGAYEELDANIIISNIKGNEGVGDKSTTQNIIDSLKDLDCVNENTINPYIQDECKVNEISISALGIQTDTAVDYLDYLQLENGDNKEVFDKFKSDLSKYIIVSETIMNKLGTKAGDKIEVEINEIKKEYTIAGEINGKMYFLGSFIIFDYDSMMDDFEIKESSVITLKVNKDERESKKQIVDAIKKFGCTVTTRDEDLEASNRSNEALISAFDIFIVVTFLITMIGIFNNIHIGFIQRKKEIVLYESIGLDYINRIKMMLGESCFSGIWAIAIIVPYSGFVIIRCLEIFMKWIGMPISISLELKPIILIIGVAMLSIIVSTIPIIIKMKNISIVEELKYE